MSTHTESIHERITQYLESGGLFNPELMDHEKVRDLLVDCRKVNADLLAACKAMVEANETIVLKDCMDDGHKVMWACNLARAAIQKAEGGV